METKADEQVPGTTTVQQSETDAIVRAALRFADPEMMALTNDKEGPDVLVMPAGRTVLSLKKFIDEYRTAPERKAGTSKMTTIKSFIDQVNRSKDEHSVIFADVESRKQPRLIGVFDYNESGPNGNPRFGGHRVEYRYPVSDQWTAWTGKPLENMSQVDFAEFLEARIMDVLDPMSLDPEGKGTLAAFCQQLGIRPASPQGLMELSRGLTVHADHKVVQYVNVGTGEAQISFGETHTDATGAPVKVSGGFAIAIPVFLGGPPYQVPVRLRYRVKDGQVRWTLQPQRLDEVWNDAIEMSVNDVTTKTGLTTLFGTPEA
ncbi:MAG: DUF2303 family protein [Verrucomicrobiota bacterium]